MATFEEMERSRINAATRLAKSKRGSVGYEATRAAIDMNQRSRRTPVITGRRRPTPTTRIRGQIPVDEEMVGYGEPSRELRFDPEMPGEYEGPHQMLRQLGPEGRYAGPQQQAPIEFDPTTVPDPQGRTAIPKRSAPIDITAETGMAAEEGTSPYKQQVMGGSRIMGRGPVTGPVQLGAKTKFGRALNRFGADPTLTNVSAAEIASARRGEKFGDLKLLEEAAYTSPEGERLNITDAYIKNRLAESKHRQAMTREAGRASERAGMGKVRTLGQGRSRGRYAAMARMAGEQRGRAAQREGRKLDIQERRVAIAERQAELGPGAHPAQAALWEAEAMYKKKMAEGALSKEDQKNMEMQKVMFQKGAEMEKAALDIISPEQREEAMKKASAMKRGMERFTISGKVEAINYDLYDEFFGDKVDVLEQAAVYGERPIFPRNQKQ